MAYKGGYSAFKKVSIGGGGSTPDTPFKVTMRENPDSPGEYQAYVLDGAIYNSLKPDDYLTITGLTEDAINPAWFDLIANDVIWFTLNFDTDRSVTSITIDSYGKGGSFDVHAEGLTLNSFCEQSEADPPVHDTSRKIIAYSIADDDGKPALTQSIFSDQLLKDIAVGILPIRYPFAHEGGYSA